MTREEMQLLRAVLESLEGNLQECVKECIGNRNYFEGSHFDYFIDGLKCVGALIEEIDSLDEIPECIEELGYINLKWVREELFGSDFEAGRNFVHCLVPLSDTTDTEDTLVKELSRVGVFKFVM